MNRLILCVALLPLLACGTEQQRRTFPVEVAATLPDAPNEHGWSVTLESAHASVGPVRFFSGKAALVRTFDPLSLLIGTAWAHPGHYAAGDTMGEVLQTRTIDLLASAPIELGVADAVTGDYGSAQVELPAPTEATAPDQLLAGASIQLAGTATSSSGTSVKFRGTFTPAAPVAGIAFDRTIGTESGRVRVTLRVDQWLSRVDFGRLGAPDARGIATFEDGAQPMNALTRGVEDTTAYEFTWEQ